jgi:hypothetical protein
MYCVMASANCEGADTLYASADACMAACGAIASEGYFGVDGEDTVQCRIVYLGLAGTESMLLYF